jgi:hypothetical protein
MEDRVTREGPFCKECETLLGEIAEGAPCPRCGATARLFKIGVHASITMRSKVAGVAYPPGKRGDHWFVRFVSGSDWWRKMGKWTHFNRIIDRRGNRYRETITDEETGETIHHCEEPLSEHRGHGSAKPRNPP